MALEVARRGATRERKKEKRGRRKMEKRERERDKKFLAAAQRVTAKRQSRDTRFRHVTTRRNWFSSFFPRFCCRKRRASSPVESPSRRKIMATVPAFASSRETNVERWNCRRSKISVRNSTKIKGKEKLYDTILYRIFSFNLNFIFS